MSVPAQPLSQTIEDEAVAAAIALALEAEPRALSGRDDESAAVSPWGMAGRLVQLNRAPRRGWR